MGSAFGLILSIAAVSIQLWLVVLSLWLYSMLPCCYRWIFDKSLSDIVSLFKQIAKVVLFPEWYPAFAFSSRIVFSGALCIVLTRILLSSSTSCLKGFLTRSWSSDSENAFQSAFLKFHLWRCSFLMLKFMFQ